MDLADKVTLVIGRKYKNAMPILMSNRLKLLQNGNGSTDPDEFGSIPHSVRNWDNFFLSFIRRFVGNGINDALHMYIKLHLLCFSWYTNRK